MGGGHDFTTFETKHGFVGIAWNERGVTSLRLPASTAEAAERSVLKRLPDAQRATPTSSVAELIGKIMRYFEGEQIDFATTPVDLGLQDPFFDSVYTEIRKLGWGETTTYGAVAKSLGAEPQAARDVGQAMATNPVPLIVPCHRVLAAGGRIGGFSAPGGASSKSRMLEIEGVTPTPAATPKRRKSVAEQPAFGF